MVQLKSVLVVIIKNSVSLNYNTLNTDPVNYLLLIAFTVDIQEDSLQVKSFCGSKRKCLLGGYMNSKKSEIFDTKTTNINGKYYLSIILKETEKMVVGTIVNDRSEISAAYKDLFRTLDTCGWDSKMAQSSRQRNQSERTSVKHYWNSFTE